MRRVVATAALPLRRVHAGLRTLVTAASEPEEASATPHPAEDPDVDALANRPCALLARRQRVVTDAAPGGAAAGGLQPPRGPRGAAATARRSLPHGLVAALVAEGASAASSGPAPPPSAAPAGRQQQEQQLAVSEPQPGSAAAAAAAAASASTTWTADDAARAWARLARGRVDAPTAHALLDLLEAQLAAPRGERLPGRGVLAAAVAILEEASGGGGGAAPAAAAGGRGDGANVPPNPSESLVADGSSTPGDEPAVGAGVGSEAPSR